MSAEDIAKQVISGSNAYVEAAVGMSNYCANSIGGAVGQMEAVRLHTTGMLAQTTMLIGDGHPAIRGLVGSAMAVNRKADEITELLQLARTKLTEMDQLIAINGETIAFVGRQILGGGR